MVSLSSQFKTLIIQPTVMNYFFISFFPFSLLTSLKELTSSNVTILVHGAHQAGTIIGCQFHITHFNPILNDKIGPNEFMSPHSRDKAT